MKIECKYPVITRENAPFLLKKKFRSINKKILEGPEYSLVKDFLRNLDVVTDHDVIVLLEFCEFGGYPDILIILYDKSVYDKLPKHKYVVGNMLRLLGSHQNNAFNFIEETTEQTRSKSKYSWDYENKRRNYLLIKKQLPQFVKDGLMSEVRSNYFKTNSIFSIKDIICIEAKTSLNKDVILQAQMRALGTTASFILVPKVPLMRCKPVNFLAKWPPIDPSTPILDATKLNKNEKLQPHLRWFYLNEILFQIVKESKI
jgi:hypothetical protein